MSSRRTSEEVVKVRSDLAEIIRGGVKETDAVVELIENELRGMQSPDRVTRISDILSKIADLSRVDADKRNNLLYWLTESSPDVRQVILVHTIEELVNDARVRDDILKVLAKISSKDTVNMVMDWVRRGILTLNQGIYVLLYPNATDVFR